jgi:ribonuclease PH
MRNDGRDYNQLRPIKITKGYLNRVPTSVLVEFGDTKVLCTASVESKQPPFLLNTEKGWVTAEYSMLPMCATSKQRIGRERSKVGGRTQEIQRLIGRSMRAAVNLEKLNKTSITIDCDVLQADGGTRTASITGGYVSLCLLVKEMLEEGKLTENPIIDNISAVSIGVIGDKICTDLNYEEDSTAETDMNFVMTGSGGMIEIQGTAEGKCFSKEELDLMYDAAFKACTELKQIQNEALNN